MADIRPPTTTNLVAAATSLRSLLTTPVDPAADTAGHGREVPAFGGLMSIDQLVAYLQTLVDALSKQLGVTLPPPPVDGGGTTTPPVDGGGTTTPPVDGGGTTTPPVTSTVPTGMSATITTDSKIHLAWNAVAGASGYNVYETASPTGVGGNPVTGTTSDRGPFNEYRTYSYWVTAIVGGVESGPSTPATVAYTAPVSTGGGSVTLPAGESQGSLDWSADLSKGGVVAAGFSSTDWDTEQGNASSKTPWPPSIVDIDGGKAIKFTLGSGGKRIEVEPNCRTFPNSGVWYFGFHLKMDSAFPLSQNSWRLPFQLHGNDTTSPKFALELRNNQLRIGDNTVLTGVVVNKWYQIVVKADFGGGKMSVWLDGAKVGDNVNVGQSNPNYYWKTGYYQDTSLGGGTMYQRAHKLGTGYGSVVTPFP